MFAAISWRFKERDRDTESNAHVTRARQQNAAVAFKASAASMESICPESDCGKMVWDGFHAVTPLTRSPGDPQRNTQEGGEGRCVFMSTQARCCEH